MTDRLKWGILGTGKIAHTFALGIKQSRTGMLHAVGSRSLETALAFASEMGAPRAFGSYAELLADPEVDCVYISMPHTQHVEWSIRAAQAGKHILCEKPMALNQYEAQRVFDAVKRHDVFFMEAFMYRCHPQAARLVELLREKAIGTVRVISATFSFRSPYDPNGRLLANALAGGGILDVGCYPVSMTNLLAGAALGTPFAEPVELKALGHLGATGVDEYAVAVARYEGNILAQFSTGVQVDQEPFVRIHGTSGRIEVPSPWLPSIEGGSTKIIVRRDGVEAPEEITIPADTHLYSFEADAVGESIALRQSPHMTWADSLAVMHTLDMWREEIGLVYDIEQPGRVPVAHGEPLNIRRDVAMRYAEIPGIDRPLSRVALGLDNQKTAPHMAAICDDFIERGGNAFDSAFQYSHGLMEKQFGAWQRSRGIRDAIVLVGKGAHTPDCRPEMIGSQLEQSLERLQTDHVDIYFLHRDNSAVPAGEFVEALNEQFRKGRIRGIFGGSNWTLPRIESANAYAQEHGLRGFGAVSNNLSLARPTAPVWDGCISANDPAFRAWFERTGIPLFAWSSQSRGFFTARVQRGQPLSEEVARCWDSEGNWERKRRAEDLAAKKHVSAHNIALAYVLNQPFRTFALIGPRTIEETAASLRGVTLDLSAEELRWLNLE